MYIGNMCKALQEKIRYNKIEIGNMKKVPKIYNISKIK
jgi:hypothetical protein